MSATSMTFTFSVIENSTRNYILQVVGIDTASTVAGAQDGTSNGILAANSFGTTTVHAKVRRILYNTTACAVRMQWHQTTNAELATLSGYGDFTGYTERAHQGLINPNGTGSTGDIDLSVYPTATVTGGTSGFMTAAVSLVIECVKAAP